MDAVIAAYALAAVIFALPAYIAFVFVYGIVAGVVAVVRRFVAPKTVEIVTPLKTVAIPEGMTYEQFDAWLAADPFKD